MLHIACMFESLESRPKKVLEPLKMNLIATEMSA